MNHRTGKAFNRNKTHQKSHSLDYSKLLFEPRSIAVIGASNSPGKWGYKMIEWPLAAGYGGHIYPVNPKEEEIQGLRAYPSIHHVPGKVDLAVVTVPAPMVPQVLDECVQEGVRAAVIISGGFAETDEEGKALQEELIKIAREGGLRFVGPNVQGLWCADSNLNLCFDRGLEPGPIAFISQSGAFGSMLAQQANEKGYGISIFVSAGNQADLDATDYMEYLAEDPRIKAIILYIEGIKNGRRFFNVARQVVKEKPVIVLKGGRTEAGATAAASHTASLAGEDQIFEAACRQTGMLLATEAMEPFHVAHAILCQPLPKGRRIAIMGTGGQCVLLADACTSLGLEIPFLDKETQFSLKKILPANAPLPKNTIDWAGGYRSPIDEARLIDRISKLDYIDCIMMNAPFPMTWHGLGSEEVVYDACMEAADMLNEISQKTGKPIITLGPTEEAIISKLRQVGIPCYDNPGDCARAMYGLIRYAEKRTDSYH